MNLFILRHASAGVRRANPLLDMRRSLDKDGKRHCLQLAHILNAMRTQFDLVVSSPAKRCLQTAALVGTEVGYEAAILQSNLLSPSATVKDMHKLLRDCAAAENLLLVGHNPNLTQFLGSLLVPPGSAAGASVRLRKGTLARLSINETGVPVLQGLIDPRTVRVLYATSTKSSRRKTSRK
ncbi:MAG: histidine phosphatase family protein [Acidobacteriota bacterium]|nr:histidine phosphatase family protein [Acidobacteriota bacterium]